MGRWIANVALLVVCGCGGSRHPPAASTGTDNAADAGTPPAPAPPDADGGSAGGAAPDAGQPTLGVLLQGQGVVTSDPPGIDCPPRCSGQFSAGAKIVLTAKAAPGWSFSGWSGACFGPDCTIIGSSVMQGVEAVFTQDPSPPGVSSYTIIAIPPVLGASGGTFSVSPASINALGQAVGGFNDCVSIAMSECDHGPFSAFLYDPAKATTERIAIADARDHTARAINDAGAILLNGNPYGTDDGFLLSNGFATHFGENAFVSGINSKGWVSGTNIGPDGRQFAFLWDGVTARRIGPAASLSAGLNDEGIVVGEIFANGEEHAAVFSGAAVQDLGTLPGGHDSRAVAINNTGRVVGTSSDELSFENGFVFDLPSGPMREVIPHGISVLSGLNAAGDAVGSILSAYLTPAGAILWHDGNIVDLTRALNDPSWQLLSATAINDKGQIVGVGLHDGVGFGYVLTPK